MCKSTDVSPTDWYVGSYLLRFVEADRTLADALDRRFLIWENMVLVKADNRAEAYDRIVAVAGESTQPYKGGRKGVDVQWVFEGVTEITPIYEEIGDGSEILWSEYHQSLRKLRRRARPREDFEQR